MKNIKWLFLSFLALASCASEIGQIPISQVGSFEKTITIEGGKDIDFWTQLDVHWLGNLHASYDIDLMQNDMSVAHVQCNPLDVSMEVKSYRLNVNNEHKMSYAGKMKCQTQVPNSGETLVKVTLSVSMPTADQYEIGNASLILKQ